MSTSPANSNSRSPEKKTKYHHSLWSPLVRFVPCLGMRSIACVSLHYVWLAVLLEHLSHSICVRSFAAWMDSVLVFQWNSISLCFLSEWQTRRRYSVTTTARWMIAYRSCKFQPYAQSVSCGFCNWCASLLRSHWRWQSSCTYRGV